MYHVLVLNLVQNLENQISIDLAKNLTFAEARDQLLKTYKLGMVYFLQNTSFQDQVEENFGNKKVNPEELSLDRWKNWVFEVSGSLNLENQKSIQLNPSSYKKIYGQLYNEFQMELTH